jgi:hypothetical protein
MGGSSEGMGGHSFLSSLCMAVAVLVTVLVSVALCGWHSQEPHALARQVWRAAACET